jgi:hypothetical protein
MGDLNAVDVLELRGSGRFLTMRTPSRPDASWSVALDSDYGSLLFRLEPSGRLASTVLELQRSGEVVITRLRIGSQMLTEDDVRALLALAGRTRPS